MIGACLTVLFFVAMLVAVVRLEVASFRRQKRFNETVAKIDNVRATLAHARNTPPGAQPTQELSTMGSGGGV
jgi:hypothetical protein